MDLRSLRYFVSVYESGSFSAASKNQYIAQPSISAAIKQLEDSLSKPLFTRLPRGVKPTDAGHQLYPLARQLLGQASAIKDLFRAESTKQPFRLGLIKGLGVDRMSTLLKQFTSRVETLELTLVPPEEQADARIVSHDLVEPGESFVPIWQDQYQLVLPLDHPLGLKESVDITDLHNLPFIQRTPCEGWTRLRDVLQRENIHIDVRAKIQTIEYALGLVRAGVGCAFIPMPTTDDASGERRREYDVACRILDAVVMNREVGLAYQHDSPVVDVLRQVALSQ